MAIFVHLDRAHNRELWASIRTGNADCRAAESACASGFALRRKQNYWLTPPRSLAVVAAEKQSCLETARPFTFRADLPKERRRNEIRQYHRRYNHRPDDGLRAIERNVARDTDQRQNSSQLRFERQFQHLERADARRPDPQRHELRPDRHAVVAQQSVA